MRQMAKKFNGSGGNTYSAKGGYTKQQARAGNGQKEQAVSKPAGKRTSQPEKLPFRLNESGTDNKGVNESKAPVRRPETIRKDAVQHESNVSGKWDRPKTAEKAAEISAASAGTGTEHDRPDSRKKAQRRKIEKRMPWNESRAEDKDTAAASVGSQVKDEAAKQRGRKASRKFYVEDERREKEKKLKFRQRAEIRKKNFYGPAAAAAMMRGTVREASDSRSTDRDTASDTALGAEKAAAGSVRNARGIKNRAALRKTGNVRFRTRKNGSIKISAEDRPDITAGTERMDEGRKSELKKALRKKAMKKRYAALFRKKEAVAAEKSGRTAGEGARKAAKKIENFIAEHPLAVIITVLAGFMSFALYNSGMFLLSGFGHAESTIGSISWQADPDDIDAADAYFTEKETELQLKINRIPADYPGYDEYNYDLDETGHNPVVLINYLNARYMQFKSTDAAVKQDEDEIFSQMYDFGVQAVTETREYTAEEVKDAFGATEYDENGYKYCYLTRDDVRQKDVSGNEIIIKKDTSDNFVRPDGSTDTAYAWYKNNGVYTDDGTVATTYNVNMLNVHLKVTSLSDIVDSRMDADQKKMYALYKERSGNLQQWGCPLGDIYWFNYVGRLFGPYVDTAGNRQESRGIEIDVPEGTQVYAAQNGTVMAAGSAAGYGNYIEIQSCGSGVPMVSKYGHLSEIGVSIGQRVKTGDPIGKTGSTGSMTGSNLYMELEYDGIYYDPVFYMQYGETTLNGEPQVFGVENGSRGNPASGYTPADPITPAGPGVGDADFQTLIAYANTFLGTPYRMPCSPPSTFDCSGFVCYVFTNSGVRNTPRTTAQGLYNQCTPVAAADAKPGDLIFLQGTYNPGDGRIVTHVAIYCGDGKAIGAGDPVKYVNVNSSYWKQHFYAYGRLG